MTILTKEQIAEWRAANWFADHDDAADGFRALCDTAEFGLRAIEVLDQLTQAIWRHNLQELVRESYDDAVKIIVKAKKKKACATLAKTQALGKGE